MSLNLKSRYMISGDREVRDLFKQIEKWAETVSVPTPAASSSRTSGFGVQGPQGVPGASVGVSVKDYGAAGDGITDDSVAFQAALNANDIVCAPIGSYIIGDVVVDSKSVHGPGTIIKKSTTTSGFIVQGTGSRIEGLKFAPQSIAGQPNADIKLDDAAKDVRIIGNTFYAPFASVSAHSAIAGAVESLIGGTPYTTPVNGVMISLNMFEGYSRPIFLHSIDNIDISHNLFRDSNFDAIRLRENDGYCKIIGNAFTNIGNPAWLDEQTRDVVDTYWSGDYFLFANNTIHTSAGHGLDIKGVGTDEINQSQRVIVANNIITDCRYNGIKVMGDRGDSYGPAGYINSVTIIGNHIYRCNLDNESGAGDLTRAGILVPAPSKMIIVSNNQVAYCYGHGISIESGSDASNQSQNVIVCGNITFNNGHSSSVNSIGILTGNVNGLICKDNISVNDTDLLNPYQGVGIWAVTTATSGPVSHMQIVDDNITRGNLSYQTITSPANNRVTGLASFSGNLQEGTGALHRTSWQDQRGIFHGNAVPVAADGEFRRGDIIFNTAPSSGSTAGWICTLGGSPGTWKEFGTIA